MNMTQNLKKGMNLILENKNQNEIFIVYLIIY
jgi:hypothetical protein